MADTQGVDDPNRADQQTGLTSFTLEKLEVFFTQWGIYHCAQPEPRGFLNPGNLCYRNSALLTLLHAPVLVNWVLLHPEQSCAIDYCIRCFLRVLFEEYWLHRESKLALENQLHCFSSTLNLDHWKPDSQDRQQDVWDYLTCIMQTLNMQMQSSGKPNAVPYLFQAEVEYQKTCDNCKAIEKNQPDHIYSLGAAINHDTKLERAISWYMSNPEDRIKWTCKSCRTPNHTARRCVIRDAPEILFVHVNRFEERGGREPKKLNAKIQFEESLDITEYLRGGSEGVPDVGSRYELFAAIYHNGRSTSHGHYFTYTRGPTGEWSRINNETVHKATFKDVSGAQTKDNCVYVLAYHRAPAATAGALEYCDAQPQISEDTYIDTGKVPEPSDGRNVDVRGRLTIGSRDMAGELGGGLILPGTEPLVLLEPRRRVQQATLEIDLTMGGSKLAGTLKGSLKAVFGGPQPIPQLIDSTVAQPQPAPVQPIPIQEPPITIQEPRTTSPKTSPTHGVDPESQSWKLTQPKPPTPMKPSNKRKRGDMEEDEGSERPAEPSPKVAKRGKRGRKPKAKKNAEIGDGKPKGKRGRRNLNQEAAVTNPATMEAKRTESVDETREQARPLKLKFNLKNLGMQADTRKEDPGEGTLENGEGDQVYRGEDQVKVHDQAPEENRGGTAEYLEDDRVQGPPQPAAKAPAPEKPQRRPKQALREGTRKNPRRRGKK
ncbi:hypothetical protein FQN54_005827 [Arachnomyces sp. PD_36]|nr:hypothetical protein FQN54_005827 [Arachnomyces sp. PD_36]